MTATAARFLARLAAWARAADDIRLVLVLGSQARTADPADEFSDVDIVVACRDQRRYLDDAAWLEALGSPLLTFIEPTATGGEFERRVLFRDGLDVDVSLIAEARIRAWVRDGLPGDVLPVFRRGMRVIVDKDGLAPPLQAEAESHAPERKVPAASEFIEQTHDFLYHCLLTARKAARGELFVALQCLDGFLRRRLFELVRIRDDLKGGDPTPWYGARMIEFRSDAGTIAELAATCAAHERRSIIKALGAAMDLHASLGREIAAHIGAAYPEEPVIRVKEMLSAL
jgi:aminoglycoside 6-adenylyltransferase